MSNRASSPTPAPVPKKEQKPDTDVRVKEESPSPPSPSASVAQNSEAPSSSPSRSIRRHLTVAQRRGLLRHDPLAQEVEAHRVHCRACEKWIRLAPTTEYALGNWQAHKQRCPGSLSDPLPVRRTPSKPSFSPSSRVATAERKIVLLNDQQVKVFAPGHVQCGSCKTVVALDGEVDYELTKWTEHKEKCIPMTPAPITPQGSRPRAFPPQSTSSTHSQVSAGRSARSPTPAAEGSSRNSTETAVVTESPPAAVKVGVKRDREEETEEEETKVAVDERPTNRPRIETYEPPEEPSVFGWLMQPLKEFARGFREGLGST